MKKREFKPEHFKDGGQYLVKTAALDLVDGKRALESLYRVCFSECTIDTKEPTNVKFVKMVDGWVYNPLYGEKFNSGGIYDNLCEYLNHMNTPKYRFATREEVIRAITVLPNEHFKH